MKVSVSWLRDYVNVDIGAPELADMLTMAGLEVETLHDRYEYLDSVFVGRIVEVSPHPNADNLRLCRVDIGEREVSCVCGAPNAAEGLLSPLALPGTEFPDGTVLEKSVIRGSESEGMLCSEGELGIGEDRNGIMVLENGAKVGEKLAEALSLSDMVLEIGLTPNRPDCLSIIGIAREVAALTNAELNHPEFEIDESDGDVSKMTSVTIESPDHCHRYAARMITGVKVAPSPFWLQDRLMSVGLRPINNIVDITNFVMMETGQPLHAFDFDNLAENRIVVRTANDGELFTTLDEKERKLTSEMLMICDGEKPVAVGGVMGGLNSEIGGDTSGVLLESAYFNPVSIRRTSKKLGLNTDASHRFERGVDPKGTVDAANRAAVMIAELGGGKLLRGIIDEHPKPPGDRTVSLSVRKTNRLLATDLDRDKMAELLSSIEFRVEKDADPDTLTVAAPSFRVDVARPEDLMEEVARLWGYDNIPTTFPAMPAEARRQSERVELRIRLKSLMNGFGFTETVNYSFVHALNCDRLRLAEDDPRRRVVSVQNPLTEDQAVMRSSLIPGILETMGRNIAQRTKDLKLFEIGKIFIGVENSKLPDEPELMAGLWTGLRVSASWHAVKPPECDFFDLKGAAEELLGSLNIPSVRFSAMPDTECRYTRPGHTAKIYSGKDELGLIGEVHPEVIEAYGLKQTAFVFEIDLDSLEKSLPGLKQNEPIPKYPPVTRDFTLIVETTVESGKILESVKSADVELVEDISLLDQYENISPGKKSLTFRIVYRSHVKTLEDEEINDIHKKMADKIIGEFNAELPA